MKKNLGIIIALVGIFIVIFSLVVTPHHSLNAVDSINGIDAAAPEFFGGLIIFGIGVVILANQSVPEKQ